MHGAEATKRLAAQDRTAGIPVVAISATPLEDSADWLEDVGFAGWLQKPIDTSRFPDQVRGYAERGT
jgi:CheY-like chemotaxis protein